ncbi:NUDIX domain-containing protein [Ectobacillus sp. sgz5001026]|uniref:NUDIX hydrolase n=1 Tax=Ectobacillus sp. sgz5001026 TaxID=3242473 RepID=UPI0036D34D23
MKEWLTIFDDDKTVIGRKLRDDVHRDGDWHETFHCWIIEKHESSSFVYFQKRSKDKKDFPGLFDITAAGHIQDGELVLVGGIREIYEELGITVSSESLHYCGYVKGKYEKGDFIDCEFSHVYFYIVEDVPPFVLGDEVEDIIKMGVENLQDVMDGKRIFVQSQFSKESTYVTFDDFCPHGLAYYEYLLHEIKQLKR